MRFGEGNFTVGLEVGFRLIADIRLPVESGKMIESCSFKLSIHRRFPTYMRLFLTLLVMIGSSVAFGDVFKCVSSDGRATYQSQPCEAGQEKKLPFSDPGPSGSQAAAIPSTGKKVPPVPPSLEENEEILTVLLGSHVGCTQSFPELASIDVAGFERWRASHAAAISRVEQSAAYKARLKKSFEEHEWTRAHGRNSEIEHDKFVCRDFLSHAFEGGQAHVPFH